jgi:YggT family protein
MLIQLADFLIKTVCFFWLGLFLIRFYCLLIKFNLGLMGGNLGHFIFRLTDWSVLPLRKILPKFGNFDFSTLINAYFAQYLSLFCHYFLSTGQLPEHVLFIVGLFELISSVISAVTWLIIIYVVISWVSAKDEIKYFFDTLVNPLLRPIRKIVPHIGGIDLSAFFLLLLLQFINIVLMNIKTMFIF